MKSFYTYLTSVVFIAAIIGLLLYSNNSKSDENPPVEDNQLVAEEVIPEEEVVMVDTVEDEEENVSMTDTGTQKLTLDEKQNLSPPEMTLEEGKAYKAIIKTSKGDITINLNATETPVTVNNFVYLANKGFYTDTIFHRIINGFMIQGGDPKGDGTGGPGYRFSDEPFDGEYKKGTIAMANAGPNTNGSQFFIMHADNPLPKQYVIFGEVEEGLEVVDAIAEGDVQPNPLGESSKPIEPVMILSVEIL